MKNTSKFLVLSAAIFLLFLSYISCTPKHKRPHVTDTSVDVSTKQILSQQTTLTEAINGSSEKDQEQLKEVIVEKTFRAAVKLAFVGFKDSEDSYAKVFEAFEYIGVEPLLEDVTEINETYIFGNKSVNGLRYFTARYEGFGKVPRFVSFELEPFEGAFKYAKELVMKFYPGISKPCYDSVDNSVAFRDTDGEHIISVYELTVDNIDLDSMNPPRALEDVGSIIVSIERSDGHHGDACGGDLDEGIEYHEEDEGL